MFPNICIFSFLITQCIAARVIKSVDVIQNQDTNILNDGQSDFQIETSGVDLNGVS